MTRPTIPLVPLDDGVRGGADDPQRRRRREAPPGRQVDPATLQAVRSLLMAPEGTIDLRRDRLIEYLHVLHDAQGHLALPVLAALAQLMKLSQAEVYEVASFYHHFRIVREGEEAPARWVVRVCDGLPCTMAGAVALAEGIEPKLPPDHRLEHVPCIGRCAEAPAAVVHQHVLAPASADAVLQAARQGLHAPEVPAPGSLADALGRGAYAVLRDCVAGRHTPESVMATLEAAGLRGLGGAGFPAGRKWRLVQAQPAPRHLAVNIDEGEPGTFKDRWYLERDPHRFLEGVLIACWAVGIEAVWIYLRDEYTGCRVMLQRALDELRASPPVPDLPRLELRRGAGAYICGEESAMVESIEGKRGLPRLRPPYLAELGLFGRPTLEHNFETLHWVPELLERGAAWFRSHGRHGRTGLRSFCVSGRVREPGMKLAPAGITLRELVDEHCGGMAEGHVLYGYLPGGASGGLLPASLADVPLDFDTLAPHGAFIGSAAVIVLSQADRAVDAARNVMRFFAHESCGQCTPCRVGTAKAAALLDAPAWDRPLLAELSQVMRDASICGLGQAAPNVMDHVIRYFAHEIDGREGGST